MAKTKSFSPEAIRIFNLAKRIYELFTEDELRRVASVDPYTIQRWAEEQHVPRQSNALQMADIIAVKQSSLVAYFDGDIDLETLWSRRNEAPRLNVSQSKAYEDIAILAKNLAQTDRFRLAMTLLESVKPGELNPDTNPKIPLTPQQKTRLKTLLTESMKYQRKSQKDLISAGADPSLVDDMLKDFAKDYSEQAYQTLLPFLCKTLQWFDDDLVTVIPSETLNSLEELWAEIELLQPAQS